MEWPVPPILVPFAILLFKLRARIAKAPSVYYLHPV